MLGEMRSSSILVLIGHCDVRQRFVIQLLRNAIHQQGLIFSQSSYFFLISMHLSSIL
jgi:hypothetical protein